MNKRELGKADIHENIREIFRIVKKPLPCYAARDLYNSIFNKYYLDSTFSARMREMSDIKCNLSTYEYYLEG
jgi:hypothetical protein